MSCRSSAHVFMEAKGASRAVICREDANATGRLGPFRYFFKGGCERDVVLAAFSSVLE